MDRARPQGAVRKAGRSGRRAPREGVVPRAQESGVKLETSGDSRVEQEPWALNLAAAMRL